MTWDGLIVDFFMFDALSGMFTGKYAFHDFFFIAFTFLRLFEFHFESCVNSVEWGHNLALDKVSDERLFWSACMNN
jgi:hypothetical protein